jgi:hypothetical protein
MLRVIEHVRSYYKSCQRGNNPTKNKFTTIHQAIFDKVTLICDVMLLGKITENIPFQAISMEELLLCVSRIEKSIKRWTKQNGRRGYIEFVSPYVLGMR